MPPKPKSSKNKKKKDTRPLTIEYDDAARTFHKRNVDKKKKHEKNKIMRAKALKTEARKEKRASKSELMKEQMQHIDRIERLRNGGGGDGDDDEDDAAATALDEVVHSQEERTFEGKTVTVTISSAKGMFGEDEDEDEDGLNEDESIIAKHIANVAKVKSGEAKHSKKDIVKKRVTDGPKRVGTKQKGTSELPIKGGVKAKLKAKGK
ncbi:hypothetical protein HDU97_007688 [Phlyctochytrium planicorne]|nr:hypothetical protein HDU97_007688 [Phlyctochytrium planicorne]